MENRITFDNNWNWTGKGRVSARFQESRTVNELFTALVAETKEAGRIFSKLKKSDSMLIGQERLILASELEDILGGLFLLYKLTMGIGPASFHSQHTAHNETFVMKIDGCRWIAQGTMRRNPVTGQFTNWFNTVLLEKTGMFIRNYGHVWSDGKMDTGEKELLLKELNELIFQILRADKGLKTSELH